MLKIISITALISNDTEDFPAIDRTVDRSSDTTARINSLKIFLTSGNTKERKTLSTKICEYLSEQYKQSASHIMKVTYELSSTCPKMISKALKGKYFK